MILNTRGRTDTVQYYSQWLLNRFREGYVLSRNPLYPHVVHRIELTPKAVDVVVFCSKDYSPLLPHLHEIDSRFRCYYHYTITAYGSDIEPHVPPIAQSIDTCKRLSAMVGREKLAWRYDPVLLTEHYTLERHVETFARIARELSPYVSRCIFSFVRMYKKLTYNMPELKSMTAEERYTLAGAGAAIGSIVCLPQSHLHPTSMDIPWKPIVCTYTDTCIHHRWLTEIPLRPLAISCATDR